MNKMTPSSQGGRTQRSSHLLHSYFNVFPTVACFRSNLTAEERWLSHFSLGKQWHQDLNVQRALEKISHRHRRALELIYDESYQFRPGTPIGTLYDLTEPILGKCHRLLLIQPIIDDVSLLTALYKRLSKSCMSSQDKVDAFHIGSHIRQLYDSAHFSFYQAYTSLSGQG